MPATQTAKHPTGLMITFEEGPHTYRDDNGMIYESGTSFVKWFKPAFDPDGEILKRCAARDGITPEELQAKWSHKGKLASDYGTRCHENAEFQFKGEFNKIHRAMSPREEIAFPVIWDYVAMLQHKYTFLSCEQIVFSPRYALAGSIDLLMADHPSKMLWILDWKSNERIDRENKYIQKDKPDGFMLPPITHLHDCHLVHYALQLGTYERLIRDEGYLEANNMAGYQIKKKLFHIPPMENQIIEIELPDASREVAEMLIAKAYNLPF